MDRVTLSSLMGNIVVIGLDGEIRTLEEGQLPQPGELIIDEVSDTSELVIEQVTPQGSSINVTDDITALIEAIASGEDPTELGEEFEPAAGEGNGSSPQNTGAIDRTGAELLASTNFETVGTDGTGFSSTQVETLLDILQIQPPEPTATPVPATIIVQEISSPTVNEGDLVSFDVTLNQPTEDNISITFSLFDQTATGGSTDESGSDYVNESVLITFSDGTTEEISVDDNGTFTVSVPSGENGFTVSLDSINDSIFEGPETFTLSGNTEEQSTPATGIATIVDDGSGPGLSPDDDRPTVTMSDAGTINEGELASFKVSLSNPSATDVEVELSLNLGDTEAGDLGTLEYNTGSGWGTVPNDGVVTVPAGQTEFDVRIASIDDAVYEGTEDFSVTVTGIGAVQGSDTGTATIVDDGSGPGPDPDDDRPSVTITDAGIINEGETANFKVTLSNASEAETQVELGLNLGDTEVGDLGALEYNTGSGWVAVPNDGVVTVPAGQTEFDVRIASVDDAVYEGPEDFSVTVTGIGAVQGSDTGTATIVDDSSGPDPDPDDDRPSVTITDAGTINEGDTANFKVTLSNASESSVQVELGLNLGDTEAGDLGTLEYNTGSGWVTVPNDGVLTVPAGQTEFDVRIASIDDAVYEGSEDFSVTVTGIGAVQGSDTGTATIVDDGTGPGPDPDDDRPNVTITDAGIINEGETANFKVTLSNASEAETQVELGLNLGDTEVGDLGTLEYNTGSGWVAVPNDGVVTVPAGQTEFDVRIASVDDAVYEGPEDFSVTVTGIGAVQGSDTGTATIVDDGSGPGPDPDDDRPSVNITDAGTINEGETANFKVTLSNASEAETQVELGLNLGDTVVGDLGSLEYNTGSGWVAVPNDGAVTVPAGQTEFDVRIASIDDAVYEGPEDFSVTVTGIGAVQGSDTGTATIVDDGSGPGPDPDDDRPSVAITDAGTINEGETANFKVTLSNASESSVQVELGLNLGDTEVGDLGTLEYNTGSGWVAVPNDGVVTVPAGQTEFDVRIASIDDAVYEGPEDFSVTVTGIGAVQGSDTGTATIVDDGSGPGPDPDDDRPSVNITDAGTINEGETANFKVTLSNASEAETQVELGLNLGDTVVGDLGSLEYNTGSGWVAVPNDGAVTVPAGQTEFDVRIASIDDAVYEGPEDFSVTVTGIGAVQGSDTGTATIVDDGSGPGPDPDDDRPNVYIVEDSVGVNEGTEAVYTVRLSEAADIDVTVRLSTSTGGTNTAEPGDIGAIKLTLSDGVTVVTANSDGTYTIPAGETDLKLFVPTTDDDVYEGDETFTVAVQGATGVLGTDTALGIIYDGGNGPGPDPDDDRPTVSISDAGIVDEGDIATFTVSLSNASEGTVQVQLTLNPDETEVDDLGSLEYNTGAGWVAVPVDGIVTVPAMLTEFDVRIATIDDEVYEGPEDFSVTVTGLGAVQGTDTGLATIVDDGTKTDDDRPTVSISDAGTIDEGNFATFTVSLSNASEAALQVQLTLNLDETEVGDLGTLEYNTGSGWVSVPVSGIVTVPAGMTEFDLRIESIDDGVYEGPEDFSVTATGLGAVQGSDTGLATIVDNSPPTARDFIISLDVQNGIFPVQDVEFDGLTTSGEQRVEDLEDDAVTANDDDILIQVVSFPEHGELYYVDGNGQEVIIDETTQFPENTEVKYRLTEDFFEEQSFDSADLLEDQGKDILVGSYTPPNSNLTFTGGQITTIGNSIIFDSDAQISVDFANQQVGLVVVSPNETGQGDEISTGEYITLELDEDLSANEAKLNLASLNDRFNSGGAWLTAYIFLNGALVDVQQFYSTDITYTSNHEGSITVALANGSFDEIRLTPETDSASDKAGFTLVGTEITSFTDVNDDFTYQAIDTDGAVSNEATVAVDFENVTVEAVTALGYQTMALNSDLNLVMGTDGDDILVGTEGNDLIIGGLGNDILTGGEGDDVFKWTEMQSATDTVTDFSDGDQLDFTDVFDDMSGTDISTLLDDLGSGDYHGSVDDISVEVTESGGNSTLTINKDGQQLEVNFDGASAADIANSLISNLEQLRE
ncbi:Calx-beta domain-containing protein [Vibrio diabolicus]|uniref:Calx-beta domain-containing protein n=1 Tax=Vibrio diabolicus TaxID=50719 RepID=UPI003B5BE2EC